MKLSDIYAREASERILRNLKYIPEGINIKIGSKGEFIIKKSNNEAEETNQKNK